MQYVGKIRQSSAKKPGANEIYTILPFTIMFHDSNGVCLIVACHIWRTFSRWSSRGLTTIQTSYRARNDALHPTSYIPRVDHWPSLAVKHSPVSCENEQSNIYIGLKIANATFCIIPNKILLARCNSSLSRTGNAGSLAWRNFESGNDK